MRAGRRTLGHGSTLLTSGLVAALVVGAGVQQAPDRTDAIRQVGNTYLCYEYAGCRSEGYSDAGYGAVNDRMYWRMYPGHNCTNYAAYRMIKAGMPNERPWSGGGNASEWGLQMREITDTTPRVGAVAWWGRYDNGSGSAGHVAYVERIESADTIVVSQDSWGGTFSWRRITKDSGRWPTGFIHFIDEKKMENTARPEIRGEARVGVTLRTTKGQWKPHARHAFQWLADNQPIKGATRQELTLTPALVGKRIRVEVTGSRQDYDATTVSSHSTAEVARGSFSASGAPVISGEPRVGATLTTSRGSWSPKPGGTIVRWYADGQPIADAKGTRLTLTRGLVGKQISSRVTAMGPGYRRAVVDSEKTAAVVVDEIKVTRATRVKGKRLMGHVLSVVTGAHNARGAATYYQWLRDGQPVPGATRTSYRLTKADVGHHMSVRVRHRKTGYAGASERIHVGDNGARVRARSKVTMSVRSSDRRVVISVSVRSYGVDRVTGQVTLSVAGRERTVWLQDGKARVEFDRVPAGRWWARAWYHPTETLFADREMRTVRVTG